MTVERVVSAHATNVSIIGAGRFGRALARVASASQWYNVTLASRTCTAEELTLECPGCEVVTSYSQATRTSPLVILAVPAKATLAICEANRIALAGKIVVDVSNYDSKKNKRHETTYDELKARFPDIRFVKCFNTISANGLEDYEYPTGFVGEALICGEDAEANQVVMDFAGHLGIPSRILGAAEKVPLVEGLPHRLFPSWRITLLVFLFLLALFYTLDILWIAQLELINWARFSSVFGRVFGNVGLNMIALVYLPGALAQFIVYTKYAKDGPVLLPRWLFHWMRIRKQLGLFGFLIITLHFLLVATYIAPAYNPPLYTAPSPRLIYGTPFTIPADIGIFLGALAFGLGIVLAVTSLPDIANLMSWREWHFVETYIGWGFLLLGTAHPLTMFAYRWPKSYGGWFGGVPPSSLFGTVFPMFVIAVKICALIYVGVRRKARTRERARYARQSLQLQSPPPLPPQSVAEPVSVSSEV